MQGVNGFVFVCACIHVCVHVCAWVSCVCAQGARVGMGREDGGGLIQAVCVHLCLICK